jgi:hypothetical protein
MINGHTCISDDGGTPNRRCHACEAEKGHTWFNAPMNFFNRTPPETCAVCDEDVLFCGCGLLKAPTNLINHKFPNKWAGVGPCGLCAVEALERVTTAGLRIDQVTNTRGFIMWGFVFLRQV